MKAAVSLSGEWFEDHSDKTSASEFKAQKKTLQKSASFLFRRRREISLRPSVIEKLRDEIKLAQAIYDDAQEKINSTTVTELELANFSSEINNQTRWLDDLIVKQALLKNNVDPVLTTRGMSERREQILYAVQKFSTIKRIKKKTSATASATAEKPWPTQFNQEDLERLKDPKLSKEDMQKIFDDALKQDPIKLKEEDAELEEKEEKEELIKEDVESEEREEL